MDIEPRGAILQRDKETYAIVPRVPVGLLTTENLDKFSLVIKKYGIPVVKIVSGQRIALVGIKGEDVEKIWGELSMEPGKAAGLCVHYVQACPGTAACTLAVQDSLGLGIRLEKLSIGGDLPAKVKIGVSGCPMTCGESFVRDIGVQGRKNGWTFIFGGNSGGRPRIGDVLAQDLTTEQVLELAKKSLEYYQANGKKRERTARFIERTGIEAMKTALGLA
ncbi:MAG TPA: NAD(P)/FAD-dependent oxidoreductase [Syntrophobacteraceae bacterium]|nr:NAD(P)/FAD-dependent oxidoreductase [Syntrophobacteraceae bacterium]